jgi:hypothetical protein
MKTALIRVLAIVTLASSMSAFAATDEPKHDGAATAKQQDGCPESSGHAKKEKKAKTQRDERTEQEKEFDRLLMGIYG